MKVLGKGRVERTVVFGRSTGKYLLAYLIHERPNDSLSPCVFLTATGMEMNRSSLYQLFRRLKKSSGIARVHPHLLRHSFATTFLLNGGNAFILKAALGHTTMNMVLNCVHFAGMQAADATRAFSPIDLLSAKNRRKVVERPVGQFAPSTPGELFVEQMSRGRRRR